MGAEVPNSNIIKGPEPVVFESEAERHEALANGDQLAELDDEKGALVIETSLDEARQHMAEKRAEDMLVAKNTGLVGMLDKLKPQATQTGGLGSGIHEGLANVRGDEPVSTPEGTRVATKEAGDLGIGDITRESPKLAMREKAEIPVTPLDRDASGNLVAATPERAVEREVQETYQVATNGGKLNLRGDAKNSAVIGAIENGATLTAVEGEGYEREGYAYIKVQTEDGREGYVAAEYLNPKPDEGEIRYASK